MFELIETEVINEVPWDVDGTHKYENECKVNEWVDRSKDGRWYKMNSSGRKGFKGTRKTGICKRSMMYENTACTKLLTMGVCNTNEFTYETGGYVCKCCGYFVMVENCGCKKITEYDEKKLLTVWYQGKHNCHIKLNLKKKTDFLKSLPVNTEWIQKTPHKLKLDLFKVLMVEGKINQAVALTR